MTQKARILIVDDEPKICQFLQVLLTREGYEAHSACKAADAVTMVAEGSYDLVITDLKMPGMDGFELVRCIKSMRAGLPIVMITGYATVETAVQALRHGVDDYVTKPFNIDELRKVISRALHASEIERENRELQERCVAVLKDLTARLESKDKYVKGHAKRVGDVACELARAVGLSADELRLLRTAADIHDIGKIAVNDEIIDKPNALSDAEKRIVRDHPQIGEKLVEPLDFLGPVRPVIRHHHEHVDGKGYPDGLVGDAIPWLARILAIADAYDAMVSARPYREAMTPEQATAEIESCSGAQFDAKLAKTFCRKVARRFVS